MNNEKTIDVLNTLIEINNDRIEGYETASKETDDQELRNLFSGFIQTSQQCKQQLVSEVVTLGGTPTDGTRISGKFFRAWMDIKAAVTGKDREVILNSCEYGEDVAVETYSDVLKNEMENLSPKQQSMINSQHGLIKADHDNVKELRDMLVEH